MPGNIFFIASERAEAMDFSDALVPHPDGCLIALEVSPNARRERFPDGYNPWRRTIGCAIAAPPLEGRANRAVVALIAGVFGVKKGQVEVVNGATSTQKRVLVRGRSVDEVRAALEARQGQG